MESSGFLGQGQRPMKLEASPPPPSSPAVDEARLEKRSRILEACSFKDAEVLRDLAMSEGGLVSDDLRQASWPILLGATSPASGTLEEVGKEIWRSLPSHRDEGQVELDVNRSFIYYPHDQTSQQLEERKKELSELITEVLRRQPYLCYFQGYHDICQVFLLVLEPQQRAEAVARLSALRIRDFMLPTLAPALAQLNLIPAIIYTVNPKLCFHLSQTQPFFALSGTLTMYAHDIQEYGDIARLFDVFLAREAVFSVYMFAQIVLQRSEELFDTPADEPEMLHSILSKLPKPLGLETLISETVKLFDAHPPKTLRRWRSISSHSVLKTARSQDQAMRQNLQDGEQHFRKQVRELEFAEKRQLVLKMLWAYRRPATAIGGAILVALLSYYLRTSPFSELTWSFLSRFRKR